MTSSACRRAVLLVVGLVAAAALVPPAASAASRGTPRTVSTWSPTGSLSVGRERAAGVLLDSGEVLMMGGESCEGATCSYYSTAEQYEPSTGTWTSAGSMSTARTDLRAVLLPNGKALAIGGKNGSGSLTAELYDPATNTWSSAGSLAVPRDSGFGAVVLANGKVLVAGGCCVAPRPYTAAAEIYDPATNAWSSAAGMITARYGATMTLLRNGKVLVAGGFDNSYAPVNSTELYDPASDSWSRGGYMSTVRGNAEAALLPNRKVLIVGGVELDCVSASEVYDPSSNTWSTRRTTAKPRADETAEPVMVNNGKILVQGGDCGLSSSRSGELYNSAGNTWRTGPDFNDPRRDHVMIRLHSGQVLAAGGNNYSTSLPSAELYHPETLATAYATPNPAQRGTVVTIAGSGFFAGETVSLYDRDVVFATAVADAMGAVGISFDTSASPARNYIACAAGATSGRTAYFQILITTA